MKRSTASREARELAERLVAFEATSQEVSDEDRFARCRVCEKLRHPLSHLTGPAGFRSLFTRALTRAQSEAPILGGVRVTETGALEGLDREAAVTLVAHLIELLTIFIGESLTLRLLHDVWPDLPTLESQH